MNKYLYINEYYYFLVAILVKKKQLKVYNKIIDRFLKCS